MAEIGRLGRASYLTQTALSKVVQEIKQRGLPKADSRHSIKRGRDKEIDVNTPYGKLLVFEELQLTPEKGKVSTFKFPFINPLAYMYYVLGSCEAYATFFKGVLERHRCSVDNPWKLVLYADEISPGNVLKGQNHRKVQCCYYSLCEYGVGHLCCEKLWFLLGIARSKMVRRLPGGFTQWFKHALEKFYAPVDIRLGVQVTLTCGLRTMLCCRISVFLGDEGALKEMLDAKGASGLLLCPLCKNVTMARSELDSSDATKRLLPSTNLDLRLVDPHTDSSVRKTLEHLLSKKGRVSATAFENMTKYAGYNLNVHSIMLAEHLDLSPISGLMWDWCHTYLSPGIWSFEMTQLLKSVKASANIGQTQLHEEIMSFVWPQALGKRGVTGRSVFEKERAGDVSCSCSEALSLFSVVRIILVEWNRDGLLESCESELKSYLALSRVLDLLQSTKRQTTRASTLECSILGHLQAYLAAYGPSSFKPKHHYATHLGRMLSHHKLLISCFTHERKHREVKRYANSLTNTSGAFEASIVRDCILRHLTDLQVESDEETDPHLVGLKRPMTPSSEVTSVIQSALGVDAAVQVSQSAAFFPSALAYAEDVAFFRDGLVCAVGKILFFVSSCGKDWVCFKKLTTCGNNRFRESYEDAKIFPLEAIQDVCIYKLERGQILVAPSSLWQP